MFQPALPYTSRSSLAEGSNPAEIPFISHDRTPDDKLPTNNEGCDFAARDPQQPLARRLVKSVVIWLSWIEAR
jgi:hypothetical protein